MPLVSLLICFSLMCPPVKFLLKVLINNNLNLIMSKQAIPSYKLVILGDGGVGKSTFVRRHIMGDFEKDYYPNINLEILPVKLNTTQGPVEFILWDTVG